MSQILLAQPAIHVLVTRTCRQLFLEFNLITFPEPIPRNGPEGVNVQILSLQFGAVCFNTRVPLF